MATGAVASLSCFVRRATTLGANRRVVAATAPPLGRVPSESSLGMPPGKADVEEADAGEALKESPEGVGMVDSGLLGGGGMINICCY